MSKNFDDRRFERVMFHLQKDEDGYPPDEWESLWSYEVEPGHYSIDNVPFFARNVSWGDVVSVARKGDELHFREVVRPSKHSLIRVIVYEESKIGEVHDKLKELKCVTEQSHIPSLLSVDCPPTANLGEVLDFLSEGELDGRWTFEEASIRKLSTDDQLGKSR